MKKHIDEVLLHGAFVSGFGETSKVLFRKRATRAGFKVSLECGCVGGIRKSNRDYRFARPKLVRVDRRAAVVLFEAPRSFDESRQSLWRLVEHAGDRLIQALADQVTTLQPNRAAKSC